MTLLVALGLAAALIQSAVAAPTATLSGRVLEDGSRAPIAGAEVMLVSSGPRTAPVRFMDRPRTAITGDDGRYRFDDIEPGRYRITVQKAGFAGLDGYGSGVAPVDIKAGERREGVNVSLQKGAVIAGRVLDATGEPLVDTRVMAMRTPPVPPGATSIRSGVLIPAGAGAQTNDLGEFRLFSLPAGEYYVQATPRSGVGGAPAARGTTMLPTYYPETSDARAAQPISVGAGQTFGDVLIRMISAPAFDVSGVVIDEAGRPVVNAMVRLMMEQPMGAQPFMMGPWSTSRTDASGRFILNNVTNGTYTLLAAAPAVISGPANGGGARIGAGGGNVTSFGFSSGVVGGTIGGAVTTETSNGTTIQYRDDTATRVPIAVEQANISGLQVIVRRPAR